MDASPNTVVGKPTCKNGLEWVKAANIVRYLLSNKRAIRLVLEDGRALRFLGQELIDYFIDPAIWRLLQLLLAYYLPFKTAVSYLLS